MEYIATIMWLVAGNSLRIFEINFLYVEMNKYTLQ